MLDRARGRQQPVELSGLQWSAKRDDGTTEQINGAIIKTTRFSALKPEISTAAAADVETTLKDKGVIKAAWTGDRLNVRSKQRVTQADVAAVLAKHSLDTKPETVEEGLVRNPGVVATALHCVNSVPYVVAADPGIKTYLDLPLVAGRAHPDLA